MIEAIHDPIVGLLALFGLYVGSLWTMRAIAREYRLRKSMYVRYRAVARELRIARNRMDDLLWRNIDLQKEVNRLRKEMQAPLGAGYREPAEDHAIPKPLTHSNVTLIQGDGAGEYQ